MRDQLLRRCGGRGWIWRRHLISRTAKYGGPIEHVAAPVVVANFLSALMHELMGALAKNTGAAGEAV